MTTVTPPCQLLERQAADYRDWLWVAPPRDAWLESAQGRVWSADFGVCEAWRLRNQPVHGSLAPELGAPPGAVLFWPKSHALGEWWLLALCTHLPEGTRLQVVGENQGGIKRAPKTLASLGLEACKLDSARRCTLFETRTRPVATQPESSWTHFEAAGVTLASHPGVFGHGKLDEGTRLLLEQLPDVLGGAPRSVLDVGCGDGVISVNLALRGQQMTATDVSAFACEATRRSLALNGLAGTVCQGDVYSATSAVFDAIVSNPPFHQERAIDYGPAGRLIREAPAHLESGGSLTLVANAFLPYPDLLEAAFGGFRILADNRRFRVYHAVKR
ncbi:16S rRNA (guanine(1207)-N(2))-methyltransferase RsmC [Halomonas shantousis]